MTSDPATLKPIPTALSDQGTPTVFPDCSHQEEADLNLVIEAMTKPDAGRSDQSKKPIRIFIMSPHHSGSHSKGWKLCVDALEAANLQGYEFLKAHIEGCGVAKARNILTAHAVSMGVDAVLCWDKDIAMPGRSPQEWVQAVVRLLSWPKEMGNVAGLYSAKSEDKPRWIMTTLTGERRTKDGLLKVYEAGTGLKLIWMWQILAMIHKHEEQTYTADDSSVRQTMWDLFSMGVVNGRYLSEDYYFDYRLRKMGFDIWVDTGIQTRHRGGTPDGRVIDFPTYPLALPGLPPEDVPGADQLPRYLRGDPFDIRNREDMQLDLQGWNSTAPIFATLLERIHPTHVIEVGSWKGASAIHMAGLCDAMIYCVDTWRGGIDHALGSGEFDGIVTDPNPDALFRQFAFNVAKAGYSQRVIPVPQTSINASRWFKAKKVQAPLIYIDGSHEYLDVLQDLLSYWPLLMPGGAMLGDDFTDPNNPGVQRAVKEFAARHNLGVRVEQTGHWWIEKPAKP